MRANSTGWPSFAFAAIAAIALTSLLVRMRYELEAVRETDRARTLLESVANELAKELEAGERATLVPTVCGRSPCAWRPWSLDASGYHDVGSGAPPIPESDLRRALASLPASADHTLLLGPFATDAATNALALSRRARRSRQTRCSG